VTVAAHRQHAVRRHGGDGLDDDDAVEDEVAQAERALEAGASSSRRTMLDGGGGGGDRHATAILVGRGARTPASFVRDPYEPSVSTARGRHLEAGREWFNQSVRAACDGSHPGARSAPPGSGPRPRRRRRGGPTTGTAAASGAGGTGRRPTPGASARAWRPG